MANINSFPKIEPDYVKEVIPISFYAPDENLIDPMQEAENYLCLTEYEKEPKFVKMAIPISAYEQDEYWSCRDFEPANFMLMVLNQNATQICKPDQPDAMM